MELPYAQWRDALLTTSTKSRDYALAPFAGMYPAEEWDPTEPAFDCRCSRDAVEPQGLFPATGKSLFSLYPRYLHERGALPMPATANAMEIHA